MKLIAEKVKKIYREGKRLDLSTYASSTAFFIFLSFIPLLLLLCTLLPFTPFTKQEVIRFLSYVIPGEGEFWIEVVVNRIYQRSVSILSAALFMALWSCGKGMMALLRGFYQIEGREPISYIKLRLVATADTLVVMLAMFITLCFGIFGEMVFKIFLKSLLGPSIFLFIMEKIKAGLILFMLYAFFLFLYSFIPGKRRRRTQIPGAVFAALVWGVFSYLFSVYVEYFHPFEGYGVLSTILIFLLWLYICSYILLVGELINQYIK